MNAASLSFTVFERAVSNNRVARFDGRAGGHAHKGSKAARFEKLVFQYALAAAERHQWEFPACCRVVIVAWNTTMDADNVPKLVLDGMRGAAIEDDKRRFVRGIVVEHNLDRGDPRIDVTVMPCEPLEKPKPLRVMRWADVPDRYYSRIAVVSLVYPDETIEAAGCVPVEIASVPQAWRDRARKALAASQ